MDAALMLAMSSSTARPNVQKAFQVSVMVALIVLRHSQSISHLTTVAVHHRSFYGLLYKYVEMMTSLAVMIAVTVIVCREVWKSIWSSRKETTAEL